MKRLSIYAAMALWFAAGALFMRDVLAAPTLSVSITTKQKVKVSFGAATIVGSTCPSVSFTPNMDVQLVDVAFDSTNCRYMYVKSRGIVGNVTIVLDTTVTGVRRRAFIAVEVTPDASESIGTLTASAAEALP